MNPNTETTTSGPVAGAGQEPALRHEHGPTRDGAGAAGRTGLAQRLAWILVEDVVLARPLAVELAGLGATTLVVGHDERRVGEIIGEVVYQRGRARHLFREVSGAWEDACDACAAVAELAPAGSPAVIVLGLAATGTTPARRMAALREHHQALVARLAPGGSLLVAITGAVEEGELDELGDWARRAARVAARSEARHIINVLVLRDAEGDADAAARIGAALCTPHLGGLSGQVLVVATK